MINSRKSSSKNEKSINSLNLHWDIVLLLATQFPSIFSSLNIQNENISILKQNYSNLRDLQEWFISNEMENKFNQLIDMACVMGRPMEELISLIIGVAHIIIYVMQIIKDDSAIPDDEIFKKILINLNKMHLNLSITLNNDWINIYRIAIGKASQMVEMKNYSFDFIIRQVCLNNEFTDLLRLYNIKTIKNKSFGLGRYVSTILDYLKMENSRNQAQLLIEEGIEFVKKNKKDLSYFTYHWAQTQLHEFDFEFVLDHYRKIKCCSHENENEYEDDSSVFYNNLSSVARKIYNSTLIKLSTTECSLNEKLKLLYQMEFYLQEELDALQQVIACLVDFVMKQNKNKENAKSELDNMTVLERINSIIEMRRKDISSCQSARSITNQNLSNAKHEIVQIKTHLIGLITSDLVKIHIDTDQQKETLIRLELDDVDKATFLLGRLYSLGVNCRINKEVNPEEIVIYSFDKLSQKQLQNAILQLETRYRIIKQRELIAKISECKISPVEYSIPSLEVESPQNLTRTASAKLKKLQNKKNQEPSLRDQIINEQNKKIVKLPKNITWVSRLSEQYEFVQMDPECKIYKLYGNQTRKHYVCINTQLFAFLADKHSDHLDYLEHLCRNRTVKGNTTGHVCFTVRSVQFSDYKECDIDFNSSSVYEALNDRNFSISYIRGKSAKDQCRFFGRTIAWKKKEGSSSVYNLMQMSAVRFKK